MKVLVMASSTGLSHLARSLELARYLREHGMEVSFACGQGPWRRLAKLYGFKPSPLFEPKLYLPKIHGIGRPRVSELTKSYQSEIDLLRSFRPQIVISDWRLTAWKSTQSVGIPCIQVINSNWGLLAGCPGIVDKQLASSYLQVQSTWAEAITTFLNAISKRSRIRTNEIFRGTQNIIPDHTSFRRDARPEVGGHCSWVGPLVPWPEKWMGRVQEHDQVSIHDVTLAFGGHQLRELERLIMDAADSVGLRCKRLNQGLPVASATSRFSFFPNNIWDGRMVITHGGAGTIYQSLLAGKPLLVIPQHLEQLENGRCVERLGLGGCLRQKRLDREGVARAVLSILESAASENAREFGEVLRQSTPLQEAYSVVSKAA